IIDLIPTFTGNVTSFSIAPALPSGLSFDTTSGVISGAPTEVSATSTYTVTAFNSGGSTSFGVSITVNDIAPSALSYNSPIILHINEAMIDLWPSVIGVVTHYTIEPELPEGLIFDVNSGQISGTPTQITSTTVYTITAYNSGGSTSFELILTVDESMNNHSSDFENLFVYPNPFVDFVKVNGINTALFEVFSIDGKRIREGNLLGGQIDLIGLPAGTYLLKLIHENKTRVIKLIKR
ncbi:putative Ig domain-containing protein, partial [Flavobacterium sp. CYK-55]|uniref:putative Ig domain-containing protein n=1 Tax=Flavobacterium sp. CYK-55 TaxID=2835529 RepID=UPI001BD0917E